MSNAFVYSVHEFNTPRYQSMNTRIHIQIHFIREFPLYVTPYLLSSTQFTCLISTDTRCFIYNFPSKKKEVKSYCLSQLELIHGAQYLRCQ